LSTFAEPITAQKNESELWLELVTGSRIRVHRADNPDRMRGAYLDGVILDEYADMRPSVYSSIIRPMLADRLGLQGRQNSPVD
jgi:phage terminase large subunit